MSALLAKFADEKKLQLEARARYRTAAEARIEAFPALCELGQTAIKADEEAAAAAAAEAAKQAEAEAKAAAKDKGKKK